MLVEAVKDAQRFGGEHGLGMAEGFDEIENGLGVGKRHGDGFRVAKSSRYPARCAWGIFISSQ